jgi:hypothetical protein
VSVITAIAFGGVAARSPPKAVSACRIEKMELVMSGDSQQQGHDRPRGHVHGIAGFATAVRGTTCAIAVAAAILLGATPALTHAHLVRSSPPIDASVQTAPREVAIFFSERIQEAGSSIIVENADGVRVDEGKVVVDLKDDYFAPL